MQTSVRSCLMILFVLAAIVRSGWVTAQYWGEQNSLKLTYPDETAYRRAAFSIVSGQGLTDEFGFRATYMPAYPWFIASFLTFDQPLYWVRLAQAVLGAWAAPATFLLAVAWLRAVGHDDRSRATGARAWEHATFIAMLAGLAVALDPFLIFFSGLLLTETLFTAALVSTWLLTIRAALPGGPLRWSWALSAGLLVLACVMLRPSAIVLAVLVPIAVGAGRRAILDGLAAAALANGVLLLGLMPWAVRNSVVIGDWEWLTTRGGISLYDGFREGASGDSNLAHTKQMPELQGLDETQWNRFFHERAWLLIRQDPARVLWLAGQKFRRTWNIVPNEPGHRHGASAIVSAAWMILVLATAAIGLWTVRGAARWWAVLLLPVAGVTALHMIYVGSVRYRVPLMPLVVVLSAIGLWRLIPWRRPTPGQE